MLPLSGAAHSPAMTYGGVSSASRVTCTAHPASTPRVAAARPLPPGAAGAGLHLPAPAAVQPFPLQHAAQHGPACPTTMLNVPGLLHGSRIGALASSSGLNGAASQISPLAAKAIPTAFVDRDLYQLGGMAALAPSPSCIEVHGMVDEDLLELRRATTASAGACPSTSSPASAAAAPSAGTAAGPHGNPHGRIRIRGAHAGPRLGRAAVPTRCAAALPGGVATAAAGPGPLAGLARGAAFSLASSGLALSDSLSPPSSSLWVPQAYAPASALVGRHRMLSMGAGAAGPSAATAAQPYPVRSASAASPVAASASGSDSAKASKKPPPQPQQQSQKQQQQAGQVQGPAAGAPPPPAPAPTSFVYSPLHYNIEEFCSRVVPSDGEKRTRMEVIEAVRKGVRKVWPNTRSVELHVFGSFANGLSTWNSDLDLVVTGVMAPDRLTGGYEVNDRARIASRLRKISDALYRNKDIDIVKSQLIPRARMPILKLWTKNRVCVDVSMSDDSGPKAARYMVQQCRAYPPLKPLVLVLKTYLKASRLNEVNTGGLSSYSLTNMVIAHLQEELKAGHDISDLGETLYTFLLRYGEEHDYGNQAVSVASGGIVPKMSLGFAMESARQAAASMGSYDGAVSWNERLCVDCPLTGRDVSNGTFRIDLVREAFLEAARKLEALARGRRISDTSLNYLQALFDVNRVLKRTYDPVDSAYHDEYVKVIPNRGLAPDDEGEGEELSLSAAEGASEGEGFDDGDDLAGDYLERQPAGSAKGGQQRR